MIDVIQFLNDVLECYSLFIEWLFRYSIEGIPVGYFILACMVFSLIGYYLVRRFLK